MVLHSTRLKVLVIHLIKEFIRSELARAIREAPQQVSCLIGGIDEAGIFLEKVHNYFGLIIWDVKLNAIDLLMDMLLIFY